MITLSKVLIQILSPFPTRELLPLASVSRRFAGVVGRLHYSRLHEAALLEEHEMAFEYYRPSLKISAPTLFCEYLGTDGLEAAGEGARFGDMNALYTRFRPYISHSHTRTSARYPTRRGVGSASGGAESAPGTEVMSIEPPTHDIFLEAGEGFSQLCTVANLIKISPIRSLFLSISNIADTWVRVQREWLEKQATRLVDDPGRARRLEDESVLWTTDKTVGMRFRVTEKDDPRAPVLVDADESPPASYTLYCEGKSDVSRC